MPDKFHIDFETYSEADLKKVGGFRYARDPSCDVLCLAVSKNTDKPLLWVPPAHQAGLKSLCPLEQSDAQTLLEELSHPDSDALIYAHNAPFEFAVWNATMTRLHGLPPLDPKRLRCTASMARRACIPFSLEKCAWFLNLDVQKDKNGSTLIRHFCLPQVDRKNPDAPHWRRFPKDDPAAFQRFCEYCVQDVAVEQKIAQALRMFDVGGISHAAFYLDLVINAEGFPVDLDALASAAELVDDELKRVRKQFVKITGFNPTQTTMFLTWLRQRGYTGEDLRSATMEKEIEEWSPLTSDMDETAKTALELRRIMSFAAVKKVHSMLKIAGPDDNRIRGSLFYHGATTGRWSSKLVQQQNLKRSTAESEQAFRDLRNGLNKDTLETIHGPILETIASGIRHFINDGEHHLEAVDYAAIEARIVCWLAGQEDALKAYRANEDQYKIMAGNIFGIRPESVSKEQRFLGKQSVLGCGYGMGASKFQATCASYGQEISLELAEMAVQTYRRVFSKVKSLWYALEDAAKNAILSPGQKFTPKGCDKLTCYTASSQGVRWLLIRLPSGRPLAYPQPQVEDDRITYWGQISGRSTWGRVDTYGGKLVENCTQGVAADIMTMGALNATKAGHKIVMMVHDEAVRLTRDSNLSMEHFIECLTTMPAWAEGLPLAAEGSRMEFYTK